MAIMDYDVIVTGEDEVCLMKRGINGVWKPIAVMIGDVNTAHSHPPLLKGRIDQALEIRDALNA